MSTYIVTIVETSGIQSYIFGSNILKHNVGASELVRCSTEDWVYQALVELGKTNVDSDGNIQDCVAIEKDNLVSELIYSGGGNAVILSLSPDVAREFARRLTRRALKEAPGLQVVITHNELDWESQSLSQVVLATMEKSNRKKQDRAVSAPLLGLGVTADCQYTGLPAVGKNEDDKRISAEIRAKEKIFGQAHKRLIDILPLDGYEIPKDFDDFGRVRGESSYIAVVHTDANEMGQRILDIASKHSSDNRAYIQAIRAFSQSVKQVARNALVATFQALLASVDAENRVGGIVPVREGKLPFRPIVWGGDDTTFVCDGRLGLTLAEFYLRQLTSQPLADGRPLSMRAGIAVVKSHFPFARAYALAEALTRSAKEHLQERQQPPFNERDLSAMDWHFALSGPVLNLKEIRKREYTVEAGSLLMRPIRMGEATTTDWRAWKVFEGMVKKFKEEWWERHNKLMALRQVLRHGPEAVQQFLLVHELPDLPAIPGIHDTARTGWYEKRCICYDAIEALEFFVPLEGGRS